jgi:DNA gyrase/topoisomerase IV subunit B
MRELAFLNKGITIHLIDDRQKDENGVSYQKLSIAKVV